MELTTDTDLDELFGEVDAASLRTSERRRSELEKWARGIARQDLSLTIHEGDGSAKVNYSTDPPEISIPGREFQQPVTNLDRKPFDALMQYGLTLHEVGHLLYTDEDSAGAAVSEVDPGHRERFHQFWNALEDGAIEEQLRRDFGVATELGVMNANLSAEPTGELGLMDAVLASCLDLGVYDTGTLRRLADPNDESVTFASDRDRETFVEDVFDEIIETVASVRTEPDPAERVSRSLEGWKAIEEHIDTADDPSGDTIDVDDVHPAPADGEAGATAQMEATSRESIEERIEELVETIDGIDASDEFDVEEGESGGQQLGTGESNDDSGESESDAGSEETGHGQSPGSSDHRTDDDADDSATETSADDVETGDAARSQDRPDRNTGADSTSESRHDPDGSEPVSDRDGTQNETAADSSSAGGSKEGREPSSSTSTDLPSEDSGSDVGDRDDTRQAHDSADRSGDGNDNGRSSQSDGEHHGNRQSSVSDESGPDPDQREGRTDQNTSRGKQGSQETNRAGDSDEPVSGSDLDDAGQSGSTDGSTTDSDSDSTDRKPGDSTSQSVSDDAASGERDSSDVGAETDASADELSDTGEDPAARSTPPHDEQDSPSESDNRGTETNQPSEHDESAGPEQRGIDGDSDKSDDHDETASDIEETDASETEVDDPMSNDSQDLDEADDGNGHPSDDERPGLSDEDGKDHSESHDGQTKSEDGDSQDTVRDDDRTDSTDDGAKEDSGHGKNDTDNGDETDEQDVDNGDETEDIWTEDVDRDPRVEESVEDHYESLAEEQLEREQALQERIKEELDELRETADDIDGFGLRELTVVDGPDDGRFRSNETAKIRRESQRLANILDRQLQQERRGEFRNDRRRGTIDPRVAHRLEFQDFRVFRDEINPDEKDYDAAIVLDRSGSMNAAIESAERAMATFAMALEDVGIETCLIDMYLTEPRVAKPFAAPVEQNLDAILTGDYGGGTPITPCLQLAREHLRNRSTNPFLIVVTDGRPKNEDRYREAIMRTNFPVLGVYMDFDASDLSDVRRSVRESGALFDQRRIITSEQQLLPSLRQLCQSVMF